MLAMIAGEPLAAVDYVAVCDPVTVREVETVGREALVALAVRIGRTRLIDNLQWSAQP